MNKIVVLISLIFLSFTTMAQGIKIEGNLRDEKNNAVSFATVNLMDVNSQKAIAGAQSNENGQFTISLSTKGVYALKINILGYSNYTSASILVNSLDTLIKIGSIKLKQQSKNLNVVEVKAEKSMMQMDIDKRVFNVEKKADASKENSNVKIKKNEEGKDEENAKKIEKSEKSEKTDKSS